MGEPLVEKRRIVWKIENFTRDQLDKYNEENRVKTESIKISLGNNMTEWRFHIYPHSNDYCRLYVLKVAEDKNDYSFKLKVSIENSAGNAKICYQFERESKLLNVRSGWCWPNFIPTEEIFLPAYGFLSNDTLTIKFNLELRQNASIDHLPVACQHLSCNSKFFNSDILSDITFVCSDKKILPAHRCIIAARSPVLLAMLTTEMRETKTSKIVVDDVDGETMLELLRFIYTNKVKNLESVAMKLIYAAEKYDVPELKVLCVAKLHDQITNENVLEILILADRFGELELAQNCIVFIEKHFDALKQGDGMRGLMRANPDLMMKITEHMHKSVVIALTNSL